MRASGTERTLSDASAASVSLLRPRKPELSLDPLPQRLDRSPGIEGIRRRPCDTGTQFARADNPA